MNLEGPIAVGNTAEIYLCEGMVVKVFKDHLPDTESVYEAKKQEFVYSKGLPVPRVIDVLKVHGKQAIVMEHINGKTIGELVSENRQQTEHYMDLSIDVQQQIHSVTADSFEPMAVKLRSKIKQAVIEEKYKTSLVRKLESMPNNNSLCHGDFHFFNLIVTDNDEVKIIDWVDASAGDSCADICRTYLLYSQLSTELAEMYMRVYLSKSDFSRDEILQWEPILAGARLAENIEKAEAERLLGIIKDACS
ncbi:aminoglycoside phosphotransferase family protein [Oceanobacillus luteolus]|uniref:Phosphotransferase family protein n=1 Tax=Oceanobacillus luteolus TaxID=1274358 RepID=A0ABW4HLL5_9BACI|nr:aminoglycoside phosphotransferase family protein [Oceanobacillus luteolus]MCM3740685.1 aminoglycoside phosphotransferase family protein [Oceanobacillus luteolus]